MPQYPIPTTNVPFGKRVLNITTATVVKAAPGRIQKIEVLAAGSAAGTVNDCLTTGAAAAANALAAIPEVVGSIDLNVQATTGIVVVPGTGQTVAIYYN